MIVDLARLADELENLSADQVSVGRAMLAASQWAGQPLAVVDEALASLGEAPATPSIVGGGEVLVDSPEVGGEALAPEPAQSGSDEIETDLAAALEGRDDGEDDLAAELGLSAPEAPALTDDDEALELDELELLDDDDLLVID